MDPYSTLEVPYTATDDVIKKAYHKLALKWHPDKNDGSIVAEEMFKKIKAAYDCLINPIKRAAEDRNRKHREQTEAAKKADAERQARARAYAQPSPGRSGISPWLAVAALVALVFVIVALFGLNNGGSSSTSA